MEKPKVTFLMIAYNTEKYVKQAVDSILNQTEHNINLLVRNNGSTDNTGKILREIANSDPRVYLFENKVNWIDDTEGHFTKEGVVRIWPLKDKALLGEYITIVDSDDWLEPNFVKTMYSAAKEVNADIAVCGNTFMEDGIQNVGQRVPPTIVTGNLMLMSETIRDTFPQLYNSFRTWWAKLFRTEFFLEHYDYAWKTLGGKYGNLLDTVHMLRYLAQSKGFVSNNTAFYNFRMSNSSTYSRRSPYYFCSIEAENLYLAGNQFLDSFSAHSQQNDALLVQLHWSYLVEAFQGLNLSHELSSPRRDLSWLAVMLNNPILAQYYSANESQILNTIEGYANIVFKRSGMDLSLYTSFILRLIYVRNQLEIHPENKLLYPIIWGCLYDRENSNLVGESLHNMVAISADFKESAHHMESISSWEAKLNTQCPDLLINYNPFINQNEVKALEHELAVAVQNEDYESACDLLEQLLNKDPLSRNSMYFRIQIALLADEKELAAVLSGTALSLWPMDIEMQRLCWEVMAVLSSDKNIEFE